MNIAISGMLIFFGFNSAAFAAALPGESMSFGWVLPFLGILASIATGPLFCPHLWENHCGKIIAGWVFLLIVPLAFFFGMHTAFTVVLDVFLLEYLPFIILLFALFTISGGVVITGNIHGSPRANIFLLLSGSILASLIGTAGASMIMIRSLIRANDNRPFNAHVIVFFIFLVSNIGGSLTALGDPPLFVGFLKGIDFFWTARHLFLHTLFTGGTVLAIFFLLDSFLYRRESALPPVKDKTPDSKIGLRGRRNLVLLGGVIFCIVFSAYADSGIYLEISELRIKLENMLRDVGMLLCALLSLRITPHKYRLANEFAWHPIIEVAKLFVGVFVTIAPVIAILKAGEEGLMAPVIELLKDSTGAPDNLAFFWLTGLLSSFLDNAPTYLIFFELAGGDPAKLMTELAPSLAAISAGAVFMGANTYIGNAPNFMVRAIAQQNGIKMPGFFGYMLWATAFLLPVHFMTGWLFFR